MLVTLEKGSTWLYNNGKFSTKVKIIKVINNKITFKSDFEWYRQTCDLDYFLKNSKFLKERKRFKNQVKNLPIYFELK